MSRSALTRTGRLRLRADRIRRRLWPGLVLTIWGLGCTHPTPRPTMAVVAVPSGRPTVVAQVIDTVPASDARDGSYVCVYQLLSDGVYTLPIPPPQGAKGRWECERAFTRWIWKRQGALGSPP